MGWLFFLCACRTATRVDACAEDSGLCVPCAVDAECVWAGNPCTETVYCVQEDAPLAVTAIGCSHAAEYAWPDAGDCVCSAGTCAQR